MKTILMFSPNDLDGVSLYRHWGPMYELEKKGLVKLVSMPNDPLQVPRWPYYKKCDMAFISRPCKKHDYFFVEECKKHGLPIWIDIDDNIFCVHDDNDAYAYYSTKENQGIAVHCLKSASVVTVATPRLADFLLKMFGIRAGIIENGLDDSLTRFKKPFNRNAKITWRGSGSHEADLHYYSQELIELIENNRNFEWNFLGLNPYFISRQIKDTPIKWQGVQNYIDYIIKLCEINASFSFISMIDSEFNQTRSANGWMEITLAGGAVLAPNWESWQMPGITHYSDKSDFIKKFEKFINSDEEYLINCHNKSWEYIKDELLLSNLNNKRLEIINNL